MKAFITETYLASWWLKIKNRNLLHLSRHQQNQFIILKPPLKFQIIFKWMNWNFTSSQRVRRASSGLWSSLRWCWETLKVSQSIYFKMWSRDTHTVRDVCESSYQKKKKSRLSFFEMAETVKVKSYKNICGFSHMQCWVRLNDGMSAGSILVMCDQTITERV